MEHRSYRDPESRLRRDSGTSNNWGGNREEARRDLAPSRAEFLPFEAGEGAPRGEWTNIAAPAIPRAAAAPLHGCLGLNTRVESANPSSGAHPSSAWLERTFWLRFHASQECGRCCLAAEVQKDKNADVVVLPQKCKKSLIAQIAGIQQTTLLVCLAHERFLDFQKQAWFANQDLLNRCSRKRYHLLCFLFSAVIRILRSLHLAVRLGSRPQTQAQHDGDLEEHSPTRFDVQHGQAFLGDRRGTGSTSASSTSTATERIRISMEHTTRKPSLRRSRIPSSPAMGPLRKRTRRPACK